MVLAVACVAWLLYFTNYISQAISVNHIVDRLARETENMIDTMMLQPRQLDSTPIVLPDDPTTRRYDLARHSASEHSSHRLLPLSGVRL